MDPLVLPHKSVRAPRTMKDQLKYSYLDDNGNEVIR